MATVKENKGMDYVTLLLSRMCEFMHLLGVYRPDRDLLGYKDRGSCGFGSFGFAFTLH